jgi:hypothetical protein
MLRFVRAAVAALALIVSLAASARAAEDVDLLLVLAADVSRSIDSTKFNLQRNGYAAAITNPRVLDAIKAGRIGKIAISLVEWSGSTSQRVIIDWTVIGDAKQAQDFASQIVEAQRPFADRTAIGAGIDFAVTQLARSPFKAPRQTIDVSGDGTNNSGRDVTTARDEATAKGITINGLVILSETPLAWNADHTNPPGGLANYYRDNVIGGVGAFVLAAQNFESFGQAILNKLIAEIADLPPPQRHAAR